MNNESIDIFLVEDSEDDAAFFRHALKDSNPLANLLVARDGVEALAFLFGDSCGENVAPLFRPKLIILDLKLPKISGLELLRRVKANPHTQTIPTLALSSSKEKKDLADCYALGVNSYLVKPMDFDEFAHLVGVLSSYWLQFNHSTKP